MHALVLSFHRNIHFRLSGKIGKAEQAVRQRFLPNQVELVLKDETEA